MGSAEHRELIPLVEVALAIMRLSCEKFFVLVSVLAAYLLFRDDVPRSARLLIRLNHRLSTLFQRVRWGPWEPACQAPATATARRHRQGEENLHLQGRLLHLSSCICCTSWLPRATAVMPGRLGSIGLFTVVRAWQMLHWRRNSSRQIASTRH